MEYATFWREKVNNDRVPDEFEHEYFILSGSPPPATVQYIFGAKTSQTHPQEIHEEIKTYIWLMFMVNGGRYTSPMDPMGKIKGSSDTGKTSWSGDGFPTFFCLQKSRLRKWLSLKIRTANEESGHGVIIWSNYRLDLTGSLALKGSLKKRKSPSSRFICTSQWRHLEGIPQP